MIKSYGQSVYSEDGYRYGDREEIVKNYVDELKLQNLSVLNISGKEVTAEKFCNCIVDLIPLYNYQVFQDNYKNGKLLELFNANKDLKKLVDCLDENFSNNFKIDYKDVEKLGLTGYEKQSDTKFINQCVQGMSKANKTDNLNVTNNWILDYCECQLSKIKSSNYSIDELQNPKIGGRYHNEVILKCIEHAYNTN